MNNFKDFNIKPEPKAIITGDKIKIKRVVGIPIHILFYKIVPSDYADKGNGLRLDMQIEMDGTKYLLRTSSVQLQDMIKKVPESGFPVKTTIEPDGESFKFT